MPDDIHQELLACLPHLRAYAISLTGDMPRADDLVQEAVLRGLSNLHRFKPGTNLRAWLMTILRNLFYTSMRRRRREVEDVDGLIAARTPVAPAQHGGLEISALQVALMKLPARQREALLLIGAEGLTYEETARICGTNIGTIKSRVNRARTRLAELLCIETEEDLGPGSQVQAAMDLRVARAA